MVLKNLLRRKSRSLLTLFGIAIGVAAIVALGALGAGLAAGYQNMAGGSQADLVLSQAEAYDLTLSAVDEHIGNELLAMPEVREVSGTIMGNVSTDSGAQYFFIFGHDPDGFAVEHFKVIEGEELVSAGLGVVEKGQLGFFEDKSITAFSIIVAVFLSTIPVGSRWFTC